MVVEAPDALTVRVTPVPGHRAASQLTAHGPWMTRCAERSLPPRCRRRHDPCPKRLSTGWFPEGVIREHHASSTSPGGPSMNVHVTRRQFVKYTAGGLGATSLVALGFSPKQGAGRGPPVQARAHHRDAQHLPLLLGRLRHHHLRPRRRAKNAAAEIIHIEGDPDHPVNRGTLCPKGAALLDFVHSPNRLKYPEYRAPGRDRVQARHLGLRARPHRAADEGGPRQELHRQERRRASRSTAGSPSAFLAASALVQRDGLPHLQGRPRHRDGRPSTTRRVSDTDRRWPVWPQHSVVAR